MKNSKLLSTSNLIIFALILSSCGTGRNPTGLTTPRTSCNRSIIFDSEIRFMFPNVSPLSIGVRESGIVIEAGIPGIEIESYIGPPPPFEGFTCLTLKIINQTQESETKYIAIYFQDGYELRIRISTETTAEYVFSSGRMAISPGHEEPNYMEYDYLTSTLTIDARDRYFEYLIAKVDKTPTKEDAQFCSRQLEGKGGFLEIPSMISAWFHDFTNKVREDFLKFGSRLGTIWFWVSFLLVVALSLSQGFVWMKKSRLFSILIFWFLIPILTTVIYMRVLFYNPNCPII